MRELQSAAPLSVRRRSCCPSTPNPPYTPWPFFPTDIQPPRCCDPLGVLLTPGVLPTLLEITPTRCWHGISSISSNVPCGLEYDWLPMQHVSYQDGHLTRQIYPARFKLKPDFLASIPIKVAKISHACARCLSPCHITTKN